MQRIRIGEWTLDRSDGTLTRGQTAQRLEPKGLSVLCVLVDRHRAVVSRDEIMREVWPETHVVPGALARTISLLRTALQDDAYSPRYIETIPKRGYRLIADIEVIAAPPEPTVTVAAEPTISVAVKPAATVPYFAPRTWALAITAVLMVFAAHRILRIAPAYSFMQFDHRTRVGNESALEHYTRAIERDPQSADAHSGLATSYAFRANYLGERDHWSAKAVESATRAVELNAQSAAAASAAGIAHLQAGRIREAEPHLRRAMALDPKWSGTPLNLAYLLMLKGDPQGALALMRERIAVHSDATHYAYLAEALWDSGRPSEAVAAARRAAASEPFKREPQMLLIRHDLVSGDHAAARARLLRMLNAYPDCVMCIVQLGIIDELAGELEAAESRYRSASAMNVAGSTASVRLAGVLNVTGRRAEADSLLEALETEMQRRAEATPELWFPRWQLALISAVRGDRTAAHHWLSESVRAGRRDFVWEAFEPLLEAVRPLPEKSLLAMAR